MGEEIMSLYCNGPKQDDTGTWYCPRDPDVEDFDCARCEETYDAHIDRQVEDQWERDTWG